MYSLTVVTHERAPAFTNPHRAEACVSALLAAAEQHRVDLLAYCVMPDHVHLLVASVTGSGGSLAAFVHRFKQATGFAHKRDMGHVLWQRSYYDHVLRVGEDLAEHANYIVGNPVRAGLCATAGDWPHSGSRSLFAPHHEADRSKDLSLRESSSPNGASADFTPQVEADRSEDLSLRQLERALRQPESAPVCDENEHPERGTTS